MKKGDMAMAEINPQRTKDTKKNIAEKYSDRSYSKSSDHMRQNNQAIRQDLSTSSLAMQWVANTAYRITGWIGQERTKDSLKAIEKTNVEVSSPDKHIARETLDSKKKLLSLDGKKEHGNWQEWKKETFDVYAKQVERLNTLDPIPVRRKRTQRPIHRWKLLPSP
jgi:hypothetical protein